MGTLDAAARAALGPMFRRLFEKNLVVVLAAGQNNVDVGDDEDVLGSGWALRTVSPQGLRETDDHKELPFIVVGGVDGTGHTPPEANYDDQRPPIISLYGPYSNQRCLGPDFQMQSARGTSGATALTSGLLAEWLSIPTISFMIGTRSESLFAARVRGFLQDISVTDVRPDSANKDLLYNGYRDNLCRYFPDENIGVAMVKGRDDGNGREDVPVIVNGTLVDPSFVTAVGLASSLLFS